MEHLIISAEAAEQLKEIMEEKGFSENVIRVFISGMGCSGPMFNLAVDEVREDDESVDAQGLKLVAEESLIRDYGGFEIKTFEDNGIKTLYVDPFVQAEAGGCAGCTGCN